MKTATFAVNKYITSRLAILSYVLSYTIPILITHPQWITGTIVNCLLFLAAFKLTKKELLPILVLPSLGAITRGLLFGPQTVFLYYFLPFIWLGNYILVFVFSSIRYDSYFLKVLSASLSKYILLALFAHLYFRLNIVPQVFVTSMGIMQLATACLGGLLAYFIIKSLDKEKT